MFGSGKKLSILQVFFMSISIVALIGLLFGVSKLKRNKEQIESNLGGWQLTYELNHTKDNYPEIEKRYRDKNINLLKQKDNYTALSVASGVVLVICIPTVIVATLSKKTKEKNANERAATAPERKNGITNTTGTISDAKKELVALKDLLDNDLITEEEYKEKRKNLLSKL